MERGKRKKKGGRKVGKEEKEKKVFELLNAFVNILRKNSIAGGKGWVEVKEDIVGIIGDGICLKKRKIQAVAR